MSRQIDKRHRQRNADSGYENECQTPAPASHDPSSSKGKEKSPQEYPGGFPPLPLIFAASAHFFSSCSPLSFGGSAGLACLVLGPGASGPFTCFITIGLGYSLSCMQISKPLLAAR